MTNNPIKFLIFGAYGNAAFARLSECLAYREIHAQVLFVCAANTSTGGSSNVSLSNLATPQPRINVSTTAVTTRLLIPDHSQGQQRQHSPDQEQPLLSSVTTQVSTQRHRRFGAHQPLLRITINQGDQLAPDCTAVEAQSRFPTPSSEISSSFVKKSVVLETVRHQDLDTEIIMDEVIFSCNCLNVVLKCKDASLASPGVHSTPGHTPAPATPPTTPTDSLRFEAYRNILGDFVLLHKPERHIVHDCLIRDKNVRGCSMGVDSDYVLVRHCCSCNSHVYTQGPSSDSFIVPLKLKRTAAELDQIRSSAGFSEIFQIVVDPGLSFQENESANRSLIRRDSLVPDVHLEGVRLKMVHVVKQMISEKQRAIEEEYKRAQESLRSYQTQCDLQLTTLLKIIEMQDAADGCDSGREEAMKSGSQTLSGGMSVSVTENQGDAAFDDDVFDMQFNDEAIYEDSPVISPRPIDHRQNGDLSDSENEDDESSASQSRNRKSSMDYSTYATSVPIRVPAENWLSSGTHTTIAGSLSNKSLTKAQGSMRIREQSPAKPENIDEIARSIRDISDGLLDEQTKLFGSLPRSRLYSNNFK